MKYILFCLILVFSISGFSQTDSTSIKKNRIWNTLKYDGTVIFKNVGHGLTQPLRWKSDDFITAGGIVAGTGLLYFADNEANEYFLNHSEDVPKYLKDFGWYFGNPQNFLIISAGVYGVGLITDNEKVRRIGVLIISSGVTSGIVQSLSKNIIGRARPESGNRNDFRSFSSEGGYHSFPSGHTVLSFTLAHSIAKQFDSFWVKAGIYSIGSIIPLSRLWANAHWISDVGVGIALSIVVVDGIDNFMKKERLYDYAKPKHITWQIKAGFGTIGLSGTF